MVPERLSLKRPLLRRRCFIEAVLVMVFAFASASGSVAFAGNSSQLLAQLDVDGLVTHEGERFNPTRVEGKVVLLVFGFTHCPDICPLELTEVGRVLNDVDGSAVTALFVSLDPERDTIDRLAGYAPYFHEAITGVTGDPIQIRQMADAFGVRYQRVDQDGDEYVIDHSTGVYILGRDGKVKAIAPFGASADHLKSIVRNLLAS